MTPLDHLRLWFATLDEDAQYEIAFALVGALVEDTKGRRFRSERDFIRTLNEWLAPGDRTPRGIGKVVSTAAMIEHAFSEARTAGDKAVWERVREGWADLKRQHLGPEALDAWAMEALRDKLRALGMAPDMMVAARH